MGYIGQSDDQSDQWVALTSFYFPLQPPATKAEATNYLLAHGLEVLADGWQFYDVKLQDWYNCQIVEAKPNQLVVSISDFGHSDVYKVITIPDPSPKTIRR